MTFRFHCINTIYITPIKKLIFSMWLQNINDLGNEHVSCHLFEYEWKKIAWVI